MDVGRTFTDGVDVHDEAVLAKEKPPTTEDVTTGIVGALDELLAAV
ncbi:hydantoinase/oxoprolinase N-terminal domain-containing protein [Halorussus salinisoli]